MRGSGSTLVSAGWVVWSDTPPGYESAGISSHH